MEWAQFPKALEGEREWKRIEKKDQKSVLFLLTLLRSLSLRHLKKHPLSQRRLNEITLSELGHLSEGHPKANRSEGHKVLGGRELWRQVIKARLFLRKRFCYEFPRSLVGFLPGNRGKQRLCIDNKALRWERVGMEGPRSRSQLGEAHKSPGNCKNGVLEGYRN